MKHKKRAYYVITYINKIEICKLSCFPATAQQTRKKRFNAHALSFL